MFWFLPIDIQRGATHEFSQIGRWRGYEMKKNEIDWSKFSFTDSDWQELKGEIDFPEVDWTEFEKIE